ncbi:MAG: histidine phosphatase family protein [Chloroflexota bacterium]|nr:histidine phosphatase family protein [Chloroflexota bacterium]
MLTLLLTRHGHTDRSEPEQYLGQHIEAALTERGREDARRLAARLEDVPIERVLSSPLERARETAALVCRGMPVEEDARLAELDYGAWEGLTVDEIERRFPGERELYNADPGSHHVGGGESGRQVARRLAPLIAELVEWAEAGGGRTCLIVGHSSVNRVLLAASLGVPLADYRRRFKQDWLNLTVLHWPDRESGPLLLLANDVAHLRGFSGATWEP